MANIQQQIDGGELQKAARLLDQLDALPGRAQFNRELTIQEQLHRSADPQTQRRIDKLFSDTRAVLGFFLDSRAVNELRNELHAARQ